MNRKRKLNTVKVYSFLKTWNLLYSFMCTKCKGLRYPLTADHGNLIKKCLSFYRI